MKKKIFTLLTLLLTGLSGAWASNTTLIDGITLPDVPASTIDLSSQTDFSKDLDGWIVFNPYTALSTKTYWANNSGNKSGTTWAVPPTAVAPFVGAVSSTNAHTLRNTRTYALRFTGAEAVSFLVKSASSSKKAIVNLYSYNGATHTAIGGARECTSTDPTEILIEGLTTSTTYIAYIYSNDSGSNSYVMEIGLKSPAAPRTVTTKNAALSDQTFIAYNGNATPTLSSTAQTVVSFDGLGSLTGYMKAGSTNFSINATDYLCIKCGTNTAYTYTLTPQEGITINSAKLYVTSNNGETACTVVTGVGVAEAETPTALAGATPTQVDLKVDAEGKYFFKFKTGSHSEARFVLAVNYDKVENVDVKVSSAGYATLYYDKNLVVPTGVKAYKAAVSGSNIALTDIGDLIPANKGVIIEAAQGTYNFLTTTADASAVDVSGNILTGTTSATTKAALGGTVYTLGQDALGVVGLRNFTGTDIRAYSAYAMSIAGARDFYAFDTDVTAINKVEAKKVENGVFYNLAGQQVSQPAKGLYIVNGKKVIIK